MLIFNAQSYGGEKTVALVGDAEERAREGESEEKNKTSETFAKVSEEAARLEWELRKAEERKLKEEAERAEKERKEAEERAAQEEREHKEAEERAAWEEEECKEAKERAAREAREAKERKKELLCLEERRMSILGDVVVADKQNTMSSMMVFDGIEAAKDNTCRSSYACMLAVSVFKTIQPIEDGAELEAKWEGSSRWTYVGLKRRMSILGDVVVADKQNTMSSMMVFDGIEAVKDNTRRSSYTCMLAVEIRARRVARGDKNTIEDGAELEAKWEGSSRLRSTPVC
ncbi:hypothetical protein EDB84DRAFT_1628871 [Lactarius hengduanensis]|nr:hypothetical protein EDB84DRAFT_1628871 [Lactarius hengduanensis]